MPDDVADPRLGLFDPRDPDHEMRLYCLLRTDLDIPLGKAIAQSGHAYVAVHEAMTAEQQAHYRAHSQPKIAKAAKSLHVLQRAAQCCLEAGIAAVLIEDAGRTVFAEPTVTCLGIGPVSRAMLPAFVERLRLL